MGGPTREPPELQSGDRSGTKEMRSIEIPYHRQRKLKFRTEEYGDRNFILQTTGVGIPYYRLQESGFRATDYGN